MITAVVTCALVLAAPPPAAASEALELDGERWLLVHSYRYDEARRFEAGWNRGVDAIPIGGGVEAPVGGRVRFAGQLFGRGVVTVATTLGGREAVVTFTGLDGVGVVEGQRVERGDWLGVGTLVHVGAYDPERRSRYLPVAVGVSLAGAARTPEATPGRAIADGVVDRLVRAIDGDLDSRLRDRHSSMADALAALPRSVAAAPNAVDGRGAGGPERVIAAAAVAPARAEASQVAPAGAAVFIGAGSIEVARESTCRPGMRCTGAPPAETRVQRIEESVCARGMRCTGSPPPGAHVQRMVGRVDSMLQDAGAANAPDARSYRAAAVVPDAPQPGDAAIGSPQGLEQVLAMPPVSTTPRAPDADRGRDAQRAHAPAHESDAGPPGSDSTSALLACLAITAAALVLRRIGRRRGERVRAPSPAPVLRPFAPILPTVRRARAAPGTALARVEVEPAVSLHLESGTSDDTARRPTARSPEHA